MKRTLFSLSLLALLASCANDDVLDTSDFITNVLITADDVQMAESESYTRTDLTLASGVLQFAWAAEDVVGIYPNEGDQVSFPMTKGAGTKSANFDGGGWAVKSSCTYAAYFPYDAGNTYYGRSYTALPLSYTGQRQTANSSTAHLGDYDYMVATASAPSNGSIAFNFTHLNSFLYIQLTTPDAATFTKLTLATDDDLFVEEATVNIATGVITPTETSESLVLDLNNIAVAAGGTLYAWMAVAPADLSSKTLTATLTTSEGYSYKTDIVGKTYATGRAYILKGTVAAEGAGGSDEDIPIDDDDDDPIHAYVDLGLPSGLLWATCNVGAENPEDYGDYFAWGETEPYYTEGNAQSTASGIWKTGKSAGYTWSSYKWCNGSSSTMTKYCTDSSDGTVDNKTVLDPEDDAAHVQWGGNWRMPTRAEQVELRTKCTWTWTQLNGVNGYKVSSKQQGNTNYLFLPAAGYRYNSSLYYVGSNGDYWSSTLGASSSYDAYYVDFYSSYVDWDANVRRCGGSVRPVCTGERITLSASALTLEPGMTRTLTATVTPVDAVIDAVAWSSTDEGVATVSANGVVTAMGDGTCTITITCTAKDGRGLSASCEVKVRTINSHEYVDLGLPSGLLWATCNVGAENPEDYGDYFAWGETEPYYTEGNAQSTASYIWKTGKSAGYTWSSYKWCNGSYDTMTKYCTQSSYGTVDNKTVLDPEDDVAHVKWGGKWRMPTTAEQDELRTECNWTWTTVNGVNGYKVSSKQQGNTNCLFLPAAGYRFGSFDYVSSYGYYWSSSLYAYDSYFAYDVHCDWGYVDWSRSSRCSGQSVRPVCAE